MEGRAAVRRVGRTLLSAFYLLAAVFGLVIAIVQLPSTLRAAHNEGVPGTFTTVRKECSPSGLKGGGGCTSYGDFVSRDGAVRLTDVHFEGKGGPVGNQVPAQYAGGTDPAVIYPPSSKSWLLVVALGLAAVGYLGYRLWRLVRPTSATDE